MLIVDYVLFGLVVLSVVIGVVRGFFKEALSLATWIVAIWVAWKFSFVIEPLLTDVLVQPEARLWVGRFALFLAVLLLGGVLNWFIALLIQRTGLSGLDRVLGMAFGFARGVLVIGLAVFLGQALQMEEEPWWGESRIIPYGLQVAEWIEGILETSTDFVLENDEFGIVPAES